MDKDRVVEKVENSLKWHGKRYLRPGDIETILGAAGYFEIVKAAKVVIESLENLDLSCNYYCKDCEVKDCMFWDIYQALRKADVWDE